ncbi:STAS domain-containing protein [Herpetosiphon geysericola]|uniref:STAS domain-containing protein n=1 Tax=Herpetosiphon geysericola TaxID=70996 RepID=UPI0006C90B58|nr:STAS domain-containing protein [Herpetosiphon geysericola]
MASSLNTLIRSSAWSVMSIGSAIYDSTGKAVYTNTALRRIFNLSPAEMLELQGNYNLFDDPSLADPEVQAAIKRAFAGEKVLLPTLDYVIVDAHGQPSNRHLAARFTLKPLGDVQPPEYVVGYFHDVSEAMELETQISARRDEIARMSQQDSLLKAEIAARAVPVVPILPGILVLPLVGGIDPVQADQIITALLQASSRNNADTVILDLTGVPVVDTAVANYILQAINALKLLGTETIVVGISNDIAQTIVQLGIRLDSIATRADLQSGLMAALERQNLTIESI